MKTALCYGDSNTYGYSPIDGKRFPEGVRWTSRLSELLGNKYRVIEEGCNGRTTNLNDPEEPWKNGVPYLKPCLNTHKPVDVVILMLGSNDLKKIYAASAEQIAEGAEQLVRIIKEFTQSKQGFIPKIILVSPTEIGEGIDNSPFSRSFDMDSVDRSRKLPDLYKKVAEKTGCLFFNAADYIKPSEEDCLHWTAQGHKTMAEKMYELIELYSEYWCV